MQKSKLDLAEHVWRCWPPDNALLRGSERSHIFAGTSLNHEQRSLQLDIGKSLTVDQAFVAVVGECIRQFRANQGLIVAECDPAALHQARVAMRRLRTAFTLFRPAIRQESLRPLKAELRAFLSPLGEARNLDVFLNHHGKEIGRQDRDKLMAARRTRYAKVLEALKSDHTSTVLSHLAEWVASHDWQAPAADRRLGGFARKRLDRAWKRVKHGGPKLSKLPEKELHRLRIEIKELRYSVEFLAPLYGRKAVRQFAASLEAMQDCLGLIHDDMVSREIDAEFGIDQSARTVAAEQSRQLKKLDRRFKKLRKIGPYWR